MRLNDLLNQQLGPYRVEALIGRGGMAVVYRAFDTRLQRFVALKMLYPQYLADTDIVERFRREAITAAQLDHPHIAPIYDVGEADGLVYLAMKLLPGPSLADLLQREPHLPVERVVLLVQQIASALDEAHQHGIIHRDIKPGNVLFDHRGNAILTDFGIAKSLDAPSLTESSVIVGTPDYIAPEQINPRLAPNGKIDHRADLYSFGALIYRTLTGRRPFDGASQMVLLAHLQDQPTPPSEIMPQLPSGVDAVLAKAMAKRPEERYNSASELAQALNESLNDQTEVGVVFPPAAIRHEPHTRQTTQALKPLELWSPVAAGKPAPPPVETPAEPQPAQSRRRLLPVVLALSLVLLLGVGGAMARYSVREASGSTTALLVTTETAQPQTATATRTASPTPEPTATTEPTGTATTEPTATATTEPTATNTSVPTATVQVVVAKPPATTAPRPRQPQAVPTKAPAPRPTQAPTPQPKATAQPKPAPQPTTPPAPQPTTPPALPRCQGALAGGFGNLWRTNADVRGAIGCPIEAEQAGYSVEQLFQGGQMYYREEEHQYWVLDGGVSGTWRKRLDVYQSDPEPTDAAPDGLITPASGFGRLWEKDPAIRQALGWATTPEVGFTGVLQRFDHGIMLYSAAVNSHSKRIYVLYNNGTFDAYKDTYTGP